jgi:hypothetical protein
MAKTGSQCRTSVLFKNQNQKLQRKVEDGGLQQPARRDSRLENNQPGSEIGQAESQDARCDVLEGATTDFLRVDESWALDFSQT